RIEGDHKIYARKGDSGFSPRSHFCPNCGSNVFIESDRAPDLCVITVGSFADPDFPAPTASIYEESMHSWFGLSTVSHHFAQGSPRDARGFARHRPTRAWRSGDLHSIRRLLSNSAGFVRQDLDHGEALFNHAAHPVDPPFLGVLA